MSRIDLREDGPKSDVERRKQVVRLVHRAKPIEERAEPATGVRPGESETQRKEQKTDTRDDCRRGDPFRERRQLILVAAEKRRRNEEEIDRHVRGDHERNERDEAFPFEEKCGNVGALRGEPIGPSVNEKEERRETD